MSQNWFYTKDGKQQYGPFTDTDFSALALKGIVNPKDYVRTNTMNKWVVAETIKGLNFNPLPQVSIPLVASNNPEIKPSNNPTINSDLSNVPSNNPAPQNQSSLEKPKPNNFETKNNGGSLATTVLAAGAGAVIGLGIGALLSGSSTSGKNNLHTGGPQGLKQRLKNLNQQGLLSDNDYQHILQNIDSDSDGTIVSKSKNKLLKPNQPVKKMKSSNSPGVITDASSLNQNGNEGEVIDAEEGDDDQIDDVACPQKSPQYVKVVSVRKRKTYKGKIYE